MEDVEWAVSTAMEEGTKEEKDTILFHLFFSDGRKRMMKSKNITQVELSKAIGITQPLLSIYITGKSKPNIYKAYAMAKYIGCSIDELMREPIDQKQKGETNANN